MPTIIKSWKDNFADNVTVTDTPSTTAEYDNYQADDSMPAIGTSDSAGRNFLTSITDDSQRLHTNTVKDLHSRQDDLKSNPTLKDFVVAPKDTTFEEFMSFNEILDRIQNKYN